MTDAAIFAIIVAAVVLALATAIAVCRHADGTCHHQQPSEERAPSVECGALFVHPEPEILKQVVHAGVAATVAVEAGERVRGAGPQGSTKDVLGGRHGVEGVEVRGFKPRDCRPWA